MATSAFDYPGGDGEARSQGLVVVQIGRVSEQIVGTLVRRLPLLRLHPPQRGAAAYAGSYPTRLSSQKLQQVGSHPTILFPLLAREKGLGRLPDILRHMDQVHH